MDQRDGRHSSFVFPHNSRIRLNEVGPIHHAIGDRAALEMEKMRKTAVLSTLLLLGTFEVQAQPAVPGHLTHFARSLTELPDKPPILRGRIYIPAYSSLSVAGAGPRLELAVSLAIRNVSDKSLLIIERIENFDAAGQLVEKYLPKPIAIRPYAAIEIVIPKEDVRDGPSPNFIVDWSSPEQVDEPIVEAMITIGRGTQGHSFISVGRKVSRP